MKDIPISNSPASKPGVHYVPYDAPGTRLRQAACGVWVTPRETADRERVITCEECLEIRDREDALEFGA